jgi:hypothetical protein
MVTFGAGNGAEMRTALWPDETPLAHAKMTDELLGDGDFWGLLAEATAWSESLRQAGFSAPAGRLAFHPSGCDYWNTVNGFVDNGVTDNLPTAELPQIGAGERNRGIMCFPSCFP